LAEIKKEVIMLETGIVFIVILIIAGCVLGLLNWWVDSAPVDPKFKVFAKFAIITIGVFTLIYLLISFAHNFQAGGGMHQFNW
jgi:hypothetical protein